MIDIKKLKHESFYQLKKKVQAIFGIDDEGTAAKIHY
jgi:hypothetical protein